MDLGIKGRVAMVAAATRGIGLAAAKALAAEGVKVSICGVDADRIKKAQAELGAPHRAYKCDLASGAEIDAWHAATVKDLGAPTILVTNTGGPPAGTAMTVDEASWQKGFENTLLNVVRLVRVAAPAMKDAKWGRVVHVTSLVAKDPEPMLAISSTLRAGLSSLCRLQARELGPHNITVNCMLPGHTETDRQTHLLKIKAEKNKTTIEHEKSLTASTVPLGRMAAPAEMGDVIAYLCSERASYVSGALMVVDGALVRGLG